MRRPLVLALLGLAIASPASARVHVVEPGDSLDALARRYHTTVEAIRTINRLEGDVIRVGQELRIEPENVVRYTVRPGDTLRCIAIRYGIPVDRVVEDNPGADRRLEVGRTLRLRGAREIVEPSAPAPVTHVIEEGQTLSHVALRYGVTVAEITSWNPGVDAARLRVGQELTVHPRRATPSTSVGSPTCGAIRGGVQLEEHPAFVLRDRSRSWTTVGTAARIHAAFDAVRRAHPNAVRVRVHDLSLRGGGPIDDHRSHQSGRDVDITYYQRRGCEGQGCPLRRLDPEDLDVRRQWTLLRHWLRRGDAEAIYVDYALQPVLYREAERRGATREELARWFQYPRGRTHREGVVRHFPNHRDHFHVRFACARGERDCH